MSGQSRGELGGSVRPRTARQRLNLEILEHEEIASWSRPASKSADSALRAGASSGLHGRSGRQPGSPQARAPDLDRHRPGKTRIEALYTSPMPPARAARRYRNRTQREPAVKQQEKGELYAAFVPGRLKVALPPECHPRSAPGQTKLPTATADRGPERRLAAGAGSTGGAPPRRRRWRYRLAPDPLHRKPKGVLPF